MDGLERYDSASAPVPVRSPRLALVADLEPAGFMPPILHGVIREGRWPFSATGSGSLPASGGYGLSAEAQLYRYALIRNIQGGKRRTRSGRSAGGSLLPQEKDRSPSRGVQSHAPGTCRVYVTD